MALTSLDMMPAQDAADTMAICNLVYKYSDAATHHDRLAWASTWHENGMWRLGDEREFVGREAIVAGWESAMRRFTSVVQLVGQGTVHDAANGASDSRTGRWYVHEYFRRVDGNAGMMLGHYDDTYERVDDAWCFRERQLTTHYKGPTDLTGEYS